MKRKKNKPNSFVIIGIIYFVILLTISTAYSFFNTDLSIKATTGVSSDNYNSDYILVAKWNNGGEGAHFYHYTVNFEYSGVEPTTGWRYYIKVPYDTEVFGCFDADSCIVEGEVLTITNNMNNRVLSPNNKTASFSFQIKTNNNDYDFKALGAYFITDTTNDFGNNGSTIKPDEPINPNDPTIQLVDYLTPTLKVTGGWDKTTTYVFNVANTSNSTTINSWSARINFPIGSEVSSLWGGEYEFNSDTGELTLHAPAWSPTLPPSSNTEINIYMKTPEDSPYIPTVVGFRGVTVDEVEVKANLTVQGG